MSKVNAPKIALLLYTKRTPSFKLCSTGSPIFGFKIGFFSMAKTIAKDNNTNPKTIHNDQCTPIQCIQKPAKAGPKTEAICHVELLQVAAFGYTFLGTISAINEKIVGPKNERNKPPKNTRAYIAYNSVLLGHPSVNIGHVRKNKNKLIKEKTAIQVANKFLFSR